MLEEIMAYADTGRTYAKAIVMLYADPDASYIGFRAPYRVRSPGYKARR